MYSFVTDNCGTINILGMLITTKQLLILGKNILFISFFSCLLSVRKIKGKSGQRNKGQPRKSLVAR